MAAFKVKPLSDDLSFGARIAGLDLANIKNSDIRRQINDVFLDRGMIVFENTDGSNAMQVALSEVFHCAEPLPP